MYMYLHSLGYSTHIKVGIFSWGRVARGTSGQSEKAICKVTVTRYNRW